MPLLFPMTKHRRTVAPATYSSFQSIPYQTEHSHSVNPPSWAPIRSLEIPFGRVFATRSPGTSVAARPLAEA